MALRWLANLILFLMLLGLGLGVWYVRSVEEAPPSLAGIDPAGLGLIEIERAGEPRIRLERTPGGWRMREPMDLDADPARVERLLGVLAAPVARSFPARSAALGELGLSPPKLRLRLDQSSFGFGGLDPLGQRRYVLADSLVHLIDDGLYARLIAPPIDFVSHRLLPAAPPPVFATLKGVPLAPPSLKAVAGLSAERLEPMGPELGGEPLEVKLGDGTLLRFLVSADRRRWTRADQRLCYVLADGLLLELDPAAVDPGPPAIRPPAAVARTPAGGAPQPGFPLGSPAGFPADVPTEAAGGAGLGTAALPDAGLHSGDPFAPDPGSEPEVQAPPAGPASDEAPPVVRLRPDHRGPEGSAAQAPGEPPVGFGAEPYKRPPEGFGVDPFAPEQPPGAAPPAGAWPAPKSHTQRRP